MVWNTEATCSSVQSISSPFQDFTSREEVPGLHRLDHTEETISLLVNAGGEEELVGLPCLPTKAEHQRPQTINDNRLASLIGELAEERASIGIERIDVSIAEIANQQVMAELAKGIACESQTPWRVQL